MTMRLCFLPDLEEDLMGGYLWYEEKSAGLGNEFLRVFYAETEEIRSTPRRFPKVHLEFRRCLLRKFPYAIYFQCRSEMITVFGLFHCARDPAVTRDALANRLERDS